MGRRSSLVLIVAAVLLAAVPAFGDPGSDKRRVDERIGSLRGKIAEADRQAGVLTTEISAVTAKVRALQADVDAEQSRLGRLEAELAAQRDRLVRLNELFEEQTRRLELLEGQHSAAVERLERRIREIYMEEEPDTLSFVFAAVSFADILEHLEYVNDIGRQDERIARRVAHARFAMARAREGTRRTRAGVGETTREIAARTAEQRAVRDRLVANRDALFAAGQEKQATLSSIREVQEGVQHEVEALQAQSAALAEKIRAAQAAAAAAAASAAATSGGSGVSTGGLAWPVGGPVVSGFGMRSGRMHEGIDISVPSDTPVQAAAAGTVIYAGWLGGYGNLVVVDHGNGLSTAYAHNTSFAAGVGEAVTQGQVIASSGSTGNSSGPHVHFEVRVNGSAVDPLGYL